MKSTKDASVQIVSRFSKNSSWNRKTASIVVCAENSTAWNAKSHTKTIHAMSGKAGLILQKSWWKKSEQNNVPSAIKEYKKSKVAIISPVFAKRMFAGTV